MKHSGCPPFSPPFATRWIGRLNQEGSYVTTVLERDLPALGVRVPSPRLMKFWTMLTHLQGQLLNVTALSTSMELSTTAINHYLDILEGALMILRLQPYFANLSKRLVKRPKMYIRDTGILHWLSGIRTEQDLETWPGRGASFESLVVGEIIAQAQIELSSPRFSFFRTQAGAEVDLLVEEGQSIIPIEVKHGIKIDQIRRRRAPERNGRSQLERGLCNNEGRFSQTPPQRNHLSAVGGNRGRATEPLEHPLLNASRSLRSQPAS